MELFTAIVQIVGGLVGLYLGGNGLVIGAAAAAKRLSIPSIVIGLTVVAFGTSAPELFVSSAAAIQGQSGIALGNVIGSNVLNIALILGITGLFMKSPVSDGIIRRDIPVMFGSYALVVLALLGFSGTPLALAEGTVRRWEGLILVAALVAYTIYLFRKSRKQNGKAAEIVDLHEVESVSDHEPWLKIIAYIGLGVLGLAFGADFLVDGAVWLASEVFGVSDRVIGITIVAFGTSLPELVTSIVAMAKKEADISIGNIVGSNIFNMLMVVGVSSVIRPITDSLDRYTVDLAFMFGVSIFLWVFSLITRKLNRLSGIIFLASYVAYIAITLLNPVV